MTLPDNFKSQQKMTTIEQPDTGSSSSFMRLPTEIRLQIYSLLLLPVSPLQVNTDMRKVATSTPDCFDYKGKQLDSNDYSNPTLSNPTIRIRTMNPIQFEVSDPPPPQYISSRYSVRGDRFNARCMDTTYHCVNVPFWAPFGPGTDLSIMRVNRTIHDEAAELLYGSYTFDFDTHIEAIVPFLSDLTPFSRTCIKGIRFVKRALPYLKEFDRCEWENALSFVNEHINLKKLELGIVAGRPGPNGWDEVERYTASDFKTLLAHCEGMEWVQYILDLKSLEELSVEAVIEHCPPSTTSSAMARYIQFSASVEEGFSEFLRSRMLRSAHA